MTEQHDIAEIRNLPEAELIELLPAVDADKLAALRAAETGDTKPRKDVLEAIDKAIAALPPSGQRTDTEAAAGKPQTPAQRKAAEKSAAAQKAADKARSGSVAPAATTGSTEAVASDATPAWQAEAYDGPLTIPQAEWRRHNIKPVREARTK